MVVADGRGQRGKGREAPQQLIAGDGVLLGMIPLELIHQVAMHRGGRDPAVVQQGGVEQLDPRLLIELQGAGALHRHKADALAVTDLVHPDQVEGVGQGIDRLAQIDAQFHRIFICFHGCPAQLEGLLSN